MPQPKLAPKLASTEPTLAQKCDELGTLEKEYAILIAPFHMKQPRVDALREELRAICPAKPDQEWRAQGARFEVILGPKADTRRVDVPKLLKLVGGKILAKIASVTLKALEAECKPEIVGAVVTKERTGARSIKTVEKGIAA